MLDVGKLLVNEHDSVIDNVPYWHHGWWPVHLWVLLRGLRFIGFLSSTKTNISKFQFDLETVDKESLRGFATANSHLLHYYYFILFLVPTRNASFPSYLIGTKVLNWHVPVWTVCSSRAFVEQLPRLAWHVQHHLNQTQSRGTVLWQVWSWTKFHSLVRGSLRFILTDKYKYIA